MIKIPADYIEKIYREGYMEGAITGMDKLGLEKTKEKMKEDWEGSFSKQLLKEYL